jgi:hypothetical protein
VGGEQVLEQGGSHPWLERYRQIWEGNFKRLDALLDQMKIKEKKRGG